MGRLVALRSQIDELRKDRMNFRKVMQDSRKEQAEQDQKMAKLISESNTAYTERDRQKMELARLQAAEKSAVQAYEQRVGLLVQEIDNQKAAKNMPMGHQSIEQQSDGAIVATDQQEELAELTEQLNRANQRTLDLCEMRSVAELFAEAERLDRENYSWMNCIMNRETVRTKMEQEIEGLKMQKNALSVQAETRRARQGAVLDRLTKDIQEMETELIALITHKQADEAEFKEIYAEIGSLFVDLSCSWDDAPDGKETVTPANSLFCLAAVEGIIIDDGPHVAHSASGAKPLEKELITRVTD
jgi:hypothetical protein